MMTKEGFLSAYEAILKEMYAWASDEQKLGRFMCNARTTVYTTSTLTVLTGDSVAAQSAWRQIGGKGKITYKALRALP